MKTKNDSCKNSYRISELNIVSFDSGPYLPTIKIIRNGKETKWLTIDEKEFKQIAKILCK
jgi:hypothetical protein